MAMLADKGRRRAWAKKHTALASSLQLYEKPDQPKAARGDVDVVAFALAQSAITDALKMASDERLQQGRATGLR
jgi:hypothetical protein